MFNRNRLSILVPHKKRQSFPGRWGIGATEGRLNAVNHDDLEPQVALGHNTLSGLVQEVQLIVAGGEHHRKQHPTPPSDRTRYLRNPSPGRGSPSFLCYPDSEVIEPLQYLPNP